MTSWKMRFGRVLAGYLCERADIAVTSDRDIYEQYLQMTDRDLRGIWVSISKILGISNKQAHDYFHNTWSKQFYDDITPYKRPLNDMLTKTYNDSSQDPKEVIRLITSEFKAKNPHINLHPQSLYIYLYTQLKRYADKIIQSHSNEGDSIPSKNQITLLPAQQTQVNDTADTTEEQYIQHMVSILKQLEVQQ